MFNVGERPIPVPPFAGAFSVGAAGAPLPLGGTKPATQVGAPTAAPVFALPELSARLLPLPSFRFQTPSRPLWRVVISVSLARLDLRQRAGDVPDPDLVDDAGEEAGGGAGRGEALPTEVSDVGGGVGRLADARVPSSAPSR